jgi:hypothetical protein
MCLYTGASLLCGSLYSASGLRETTGEYSAASGTHLVTDLRYFISSRSRTCRVCDTKLALLGGLVKAQRWKILRELRQK